MNHLIFSGYVLICIFQTVFSFSEGCESSITYFSKNEIPFDFNSIRNLVVFGYFFFFLHIKFIYIMIKIFFLLLY